MHLAGQKQILGFVVIFFLYTPESEWVPSRCVSFSSLVTPLFNRINSKSKLPVHFPVTMCLVTVVTITLKDQKPALFI